jgi:hypothetical protein
MNIDKITINDIRQRGFNVKIRHERTFNPVASLPNLYLTKAQFKYNNGEAVSSALMDLKNAIDVYLDPKISEQERKVALKNLYQLDNADGFTQVSLFDKNDRLIGTGVAEVNTKQKNGRKDSFNRKLGFKIALGRALEEAEYAGEIDLEDFYESVNDENFAKILDSQKLIDSI